MFEFNTFKELQWKRYFYLSILRDESFRNKTFPIKFLTFLSPGGVFQIINNKWYVHEG